MEETKGFLLFLLPYREVYTFESLTTNQVIFWTLLFILIVFAEFFVFQNGSFFFLIAGVALLYWSVTRNKRLYFWISILLLFHSLLSMWSLRLFIVLFLMFLLYLFLSKQHEDPIQVQLGEQLPDNQVTKNKLFGTTSPPLEDTKWRDVHIQRLVGDVTIDTTQTILPPGTSFISIRQGFGTVKVFLPYEIPVRIQYTTLYGEAKI